MTFVYSKIVKKSRIIFTALLLFYIGNYCYAGSLFTSIGYSPGLTDYYRTDPDPHTHSYKYVPLAMDLSTVYLNDKNFGFGLGLHLGRIDKMKMANSEASITTEDWTGEIYQLNLTPYFNYSPYHKENMILILGIGPSTTMNFYTSEWGNDTNEYYWGISLNIEYHYLFHDIFFLKAAFRFTVDFIGLWDSEAITSILQTQYYPSMGVGFEF